MLFPICSFCKDLKLEKKTVYNGQQNDSNNFLYIKYHNTGLALDVSINPVSCTREPCGLISSDSLFLSFFSSCRKKQDISRPHSERFVKSDLSIGYNLAASRLIYLKEVKTFNLSSQEVDEGTFCRRSQQVSVYNLPSMKTTVIPVVLCRFFKPYS